MTKQHEAIPPAAQIAIWADKLRDLSATGLKYVKDPYDQGRYECLQNLALEMFAYATAQPLEALAPLKATLFTRMSPVVAGAAAVIDQAGQILLMRRTDNHLWAMPAGQMEVGETPAEAVVRETYEETGIRCVPMALVGVYDSRFSDRAGAQQVYKFTFWCEPVVEQPPAAFDPHETLEIRWFPENELPAELYPGHAKRIADAYQARKGNFQAHFDWE
jgi:8-oxo-dGTP pyrophosphatase MutT (NUDIX family)